MNNKRMFFLKSLIFTIFSPAFYREAYQKGAKKGIGVYILFTLIASLIITIYFTIMFGIQVISLPDRLADMPELIVQNGELTVRGLKMPYEQENSTTYFAIDTTDTVTSIDSKYQQGIILNSTEMVVMVVKAENRQIQYISYADILDQMERESIIINQTTVTQFIQNFSVLLMLLSPIIIFLAYLCWRFVLIMIITLIGTVVLSVLKQQEAFRKSFIISLYASIPALYVTFLSSLIMGLVSRLVPEVSSIAAATCCMIPIVFWLIKWFVFWSIGVFGVRNQA